ncbi:PP2C family protein-serine/threonine phosphatase [Geotoga petraea]|jgi:sigma-B regulation protein RsbU (phosphoserine phosphatase)|nr:PP2C family protein-serine/threonine phosphatase [Geotoga petraea]MDK2945436.1 phosphoserine phosphatase RsbU/P [Geotoga sp.]SDC00016.1 sigma-B regulation protein RsbU (phosphoserine phosphatase) [Geotoga petraea]
MDNFYDKIYNKLNETLNIYKDKVSDEKIVKKRSEYLIDKYLKELNNYKIQMEENTLILEAQYEEISRIYEELTTVLEISKLVFANKDPRLSIETIVERLKSSIIFKNIVVGEFVNFDKSLDFKPLFLDLVDLDYENINPLINLFKKNEEPKTILKETDEINSKDTSFILLPIKSQIKTWGFILLYGKTDNSFYLASDKKIMESVTEQIAFGFDTINYLDEKIEQQKINEQMKLAREIQSSLLPDEIPEIANVSTSAFYRSAYEVGGDYYDIIKISNHEILGLVADVSGKGVPAALIMSSLRAIVRSKAEENKGLMEMVNYLNKYLNKNIPDDRFVTAIFVLINSKTKKVQVINAGHNTTPYLKDGKVHYIDSTGLPLGVSEDFGYEIEAIEYEKEFLIANFTDGVTEARNEYKEEYGEKRLENVIKEISKKNTNVIVKSIIDSVDQFVKETPQHDDITLLIIKGF